MQTDSRLEWVQANRSRRSRVCHIAAPIGRVARSVAAFADVRKASEIAKRVALVVDDTFRAHCRIALPDERTLVVSVDRPALVYAMRSQWLKPLRAALPDMRGRRIVFEYGCAGARVAVETAGRR